MKCQCWMGRDACHEGEACAAENALEYGTDCRWLCIDCARYLFGPRGVPIMRGVAQFIGHGELVAPFKVE